ncbi:CBS domain-containing protein [bacterium]|nr:CBS domain-containing protein [bacterium]
MQVSLWMKEKPYCVTANDRLDDVARAMSEGGFRHAPVVDPAGHLVGMLSDRDLREHKGYLPTTRVSAAMSEPAITIGPDEPIERAAHLMRQHTIGALPVVDAQRRVIGILTETDILDGLLDGIGVGEHAARIDFTFTSPRQSFAEVVQAVEQAGATVLGLGTFQATGDGSGARRFFVRVTAPRIEAVIEALSRADILIDAVQHLKVRAA